MNISDRITDNNRNIVFKPVISGGYGYYLTADDAAHIEFIDGNTSSVTVTVEPFKRYVVDSRENGNVTLNCSALDGRFYSAEVICNFAAAGQYKIIMTSFDKVEGYESKEIDKSGTYLIHIENWNGYKYAVVNKNDGNVMKSSFEPTLTGLNVTFGSGYVNPTYTMQNTDLINGALSYTPSSFSWDASYNDIQIKVAFDNNEWVYGIYDKKAFAVAKHATGAYAYMNGIWIADREDITETPTAYYHFVPSTEDFSNTWVKESLNGIVYDTKGSKLTEAKYKKMTVANLKDLIIYLYSQRKTCQKKYGNNNWIYCMVWYRFIKE